MKALSTLKRIRWTARISGAFLAMFCLAFFIGSIFEGMNKPASGIGLGTYNTIVFVVWGIGLASYILAWWKEKLGGMISFISIVFFNILAASSPVKDASYTPILLLFLIPSVLFLICWRIEAKQINKI